METGVPGVVYQNDRKKTHKIKSMLKIYQAYEHTLTNTF